MSAGRKWIVAGGVLLATLGLLVGVGVLIVTAPSPTWPTDGSHDSNRWYQHDLGDKAMASDGSDYRLYVKTGSSDNLIVFFGGGGVTWDEKSTEYPITAASYLFGDDPGNYFRSIPSFFPTTLGGILEANNPANPFNDWNVVVIPYATGDFHTGNGSTENMKYNGQENVQLAFEWIYSTMPVNPQKVLIAGGSAGGFGATFWTPTLAEAYADSTVYSFSEGNQLASEKWPTAVDELWHADWADTFGYEPGPNLYETAVVANRERLGDNVVFLDSNTTADATLIQFSAKINDHAPDPSGWSAEMRASMSRLSESVSNYYFYLSEDDANPDTGLTPHTLSSLPGFYTTVQDGVPFTEWLAAAVIDDEPYSVGASLLK